MFDIESSRNIWVSPNADGDELGTYDNPYSSVADALKKCSAGQAVVLMPGVYDGDLTVEISGEENSPIYITTYKQGESIIDGGCWYFYDTCDLVVSGMTFRNAPHGAVSLVGQCLRNRFHSIKFIDCGTDGKESCTFYIGGAGGKYNLVEDCEFSRSVNGGKKSSSEKPVVGLMVSDGADGHPLIHHIIRHNKFCGYDRAMIIGSGSMADFESGHIVERNRVEDCRADGIAVKCGDVWVRRNAVANCAASGVAILGGEYSFAENNIISSCDIGVSVTGNGHTVTGNTFAVCAHQVKPQGECEGLIDDENSIQQTPPADDVVDDCVDGGDGFDTDEEIDSYISASKPRDGSDYDDTDAEEDEEGHVVIGGDGQRIIDDNDDDTNGEMDEVLRYMFGRE